MLNLITSIAVLLLMLGGLFLIVGQRRWAMKMVMAGVGVAVILPVVVNWFSGNCLVQIGGWTFQGRMAVVIVGIMVIAALLLYLSRHRLVTALFVVLALYFKLSFRVGIRVIEMASRFPPPLLPQPEKFIVAVAAVLTIQAVIIAVALIAAGTLMATDWPLCLPFVVGVVVGLIGRWRYLRAERQGLGNV